MSTIVMTAMKPMHARVASRVKKQSQWGGQNKFGPCAKNDESDDNAKSRAETVNPAASNALGKI